MQHHIGMSVLLILPNYAQTAQSSLLSPPQLTVLRWKLAGHHPDACFVLLLHVSQWCDLSYFGMTPISPLDQDTFSAFGVLFFSPKPPWMCNWEAAKFVKETFLCWSYCVCKRCKTKGSKSVRQNIEFMIIFKSASWFWLTRSKYLGLMMYASLFLCPSPLAFHSLSSPSLRPASGIYRLGSLLLLQSWLADFGDGVAA